MTKDVAELLQIARGALADIARSTDMTKDQLQAKANRVYWETEPPEEPPDKDKFHEREPLNIIMRYKAERTTEVEAAAEIRAYVVECARRAAEPPVPREQRIAQLQAEIREHLTEDEPTSPHYCDCPVGTCQGGPIQRCVFRIFDVDASDVRGDLNRGTPRE